MAIHFFNILVIKLLCRCIILIPNLTRKLYKLNNYCFVQGILESNIFSCYLQYNYLNRHVTKSISLKNYCKIKLSA